MTCYHVDLPGGGRAIVCGRLGPHCNHCGRMGTLLCDFPAGGGKTCDARICEVHATKMGLDIDYCPAHAQRAAERGLVAGAFTTQPELF